MPIVKNIAIKIKIAPVDNEVILTSFKNLQVR